MGKPTEKLAHEEHLRARGFIKEEHPGIANLFVIAVLATLGEEATAESIPEGLSEYRHVPIKEGHCNVALIRTGDKCSAWAQTIPKTA